MTARNALFSLALSLSCCLLLPLMALAEPVELRSADGQLVVTGDLVSSDGHLATIASPKFGVMRLELDRFECTGPGCVKLRGAEGFSIHGSNTIGESLTPTLVQSFAAIRQLRLEKKVGANAEEMGMELRETGGTRYASVDLRSHGSGTAFPGLISGAADIGASSRPIKPEEEKALLDAGYHVEPHVLALDGLLVLVAPSNPVNELSLEQIAKIFSGEVQDWAQLGGAPGAIQIYARDGKSGTYDTFDTLVLKPHKVKLSDKARRFESSIELSDSVARDPNGIGFIGFAYQRNAKALGIRSACGISSRPTEFSVRTEEYALARRLYYYTTDKLRSQQAKNFLEFALSDEAQSTVTDAGFINQSIEFLPFGQQADRIALAVNAPPEDFNIAVLKQLVSLVQNARRMSITFRFEKNSGVLDAKAQQDVSRLARYLKSDAMKGKQVLLLGFTDSTGPFEANTLISLARASAVQAALVKSAGGGIDPAALTVKAFSEIMPVDCNATDDGRAKNRRVEVWVRD